MSIEGVGGAAGMANLQMISRPEASAIDQAQQSLNEVSKQDATQASGQEAPDAVNSVNTLSDGTIQFLTMNYASDMVNPLITAEIGGEGSNDNKSDDTTSIMKLALAHEVYQAMNSLASSSFGGGEGSGGTAANSIAGGDAGSATGGAGGGAGGAGAGGGISA